MDRVFYLIHLNKASMTLLRNLTKMLNVLINAKHKPEYTEEIFWYVAIFKSFEFITIESVTKSTSISTSRKL